MFSFFFEKTKKKNAAEGRTSGRPVRRTKKRRKKKEKKRKNKSTTTLGREGGHQLFGEGGGQIGWSKMPMGRLLSLPARTRGLCFPNASKGLGQPLHVVCPQKKQKFINKSSSKSNFFHNQIESLGQNQTRLGWHAKNNPCFCESVPSKHGSGA